MTADQLTGADMTGTRKRYPARVGMMSLIGVSKQRPVAWGNYFWLRDGPRISNFWAENLDEATRRFLPDGEVEVVEWLGGEIAVIDDARIPPEWYYDRMCWTGGRRPPLEVAREMFDARGGDPLNELEQWTDPKTYWAKRGGMYSDKGFVVTFIQQQEPT